MDTADTKMLKQFFLLLATAAQTFAATCNVDSSNGASDDSPAIKQAFARCAKDSVINFAEGARYNVYNPISAHNLSNVTINMQGNMHLPDNVTYIQTLVDASAANTNATALYWFDLLGPGINWVGTSNVSNGWIECYGQKWWDLNPVNGTGTPARPHLMSYSTQNGFMSHMKVHQMIAWGLSVNGTVSNITICACGLISSPKTRWIVVQVNRLTIFRM